tara:strand:+ start:138 stop:557 length:420 start_codon:yes stop_codon:yes gene_type:complete
MHILEYITKAMNSRYWHTRVQFYVEFNSNVLTALREQGWNGKYMSAGDMSRCLTQETKNLYSKIAIGTYNDGTDRTMNWGVHSFADRWLNNVKGIAKFNRALTESGYTGGSFVVEKDAELARELGYRKNEFLFKLVEAQ